MFELEDSTLQDAPHGSEVRFEVEVLELEVPHEFELELFDELHAFEVE